MWLLKGVQFVSRCSAHCYKGMASSYQDAVHALNTLQSNAAVIEKIRLTRDSLNHLSLPDTISMANRAGITMNDIDKLSIIHVSGTKGKGSTCAFTESILRSHGFKTGFFSSPHLVEVRERIRIDGKPLSREDFSLYFWHCYQLLEKSKPDHGGSMPPYFRFLTIMAFHVFIVEKVDVVVLEVGIGGEYDCTNIVRHPVVCGVTNLGIDHTSMLGDTIEKIAWHKAGIFKAGVPAVTVQQPDGAMQVLQDRARDIQCPLYLAPKLGQYHWKDHEISLGIPGSHQANNASLALQLSQFWLNNHMKAINERKLSVLPSGIEQASAFEITSQMAVGLKECCWPGRSQKILGPDITYYLDGAHTDASIELCADWFKTTCAADEAAIGGPVVRVLLFNSTGDRKAETLLSGLLDCKFDCAVFCPNIQRLSGKQNEDLVDMKATLDSQLRRCNENRNAWLDLLSSQRGSRRTGNAGDIPPNFDDVGSRGQGGSGLSGAGDGDEYPMPTLTFNSIADSLWWISRGRDGRLANGLSIDCTYVGFERLRTAKHVFVLCTGSLHLVGGILSLLDPLVCDN